MNGQSLSIEVIESTHFLTINRPESDNKLNIPFMTELVRVLKAAETDQSCRVVVLTASGKYFCNGGELGDFRIKSPLQIREFGEAFIDLHTAIHTLSKPVIAAIQGHVMGGGFSLVEACDLAVASEDALFGVPEIRSGLAPMMALTGVSRVFSRKKLMEMALLGEVISAAEAKQIGLVNRVCPKERVIDEALKIAGQLKMNNPTAIALCKKLYRDLDCLPYERQLEAGLSMLVVLLKSEDAAEALTANEEHRLPDWKGR
ncbi:MAG: enoyl-CoA hydratase/isomerase family protein [Bacteroidota bacterium]